MCYSVCWRLWKVGFEPSFGVSKFPLSQFSRYGPPPLGFDGAVFISWACSHVCWSSDVPIIPKVLIVHVRLARDSSLTFRIHCLDFTLMPILMMLMRGPKSEGRCE